VTDVTVRVDPDVIEAAARALGIWQPNITPHAMGAQVLRELAGHRARSAIADGGAAPKRAGRAWENMIVKYAREAGLPWDRAVGRGAGARDLLDVTGCLPGGWLVGGKSSNRGQAAAVKLADAMDQCHRALGVLAARGEADGVVPFQIIRRPNVDIGRAYAITEYDWFLQLCKLRQAAREERAW
jgi:hypothetical protein